MSNLIDISALHKDFKTIAEWQSFAEKQTKLILELNKTIKQKNEEIEQLKSISYQEQSVEKIIISPEEALVDSQIDMLNARSYGKELNLEDIKKLDILLKHKKTFRDEFDTLKGKSKKISIPSSDLLQIVEQKSDGK